MTVYYIIFNNIYGLVIVSLLQKMAQTGLYAFDGMTHKHNIITQVYIANT